MVEGRSKTFLGSFFACVLIVLSGPVDAPAQSYCWLDGNYTGDQICNAIDPPDGYVQIPEICGSFADWLRHLPIKNKSDTVFLYDGSPKYNQNAQWAVIDIDTGNEDLQQCADAVIRLRAEYFYSKNLYDSISFNFTSGDTCRFRDWIEGLRPIVDGNRVTWTKSAGADSSYTNFRKYLKTVFTYAGSYSLQKQLRPVPDVDSIAVGDVFIRGGFPGHAVIVVDMAKHKDTGEKLFLLAQSYMPAQDVHILKNPQNADLNPWYPVEFENPLITPEWQFNKDELRRFQ